jgi:methionine-rich copper-binding protein CopC
VKQTAEQVASMHRASMILPGDGRPGRRIWRLQPECAVGPVAIVMPDVDPQDLVKVVAPEDQQPVQALGPHRTDLVRVNGGMSTLIAVRRLIVGVLLAGLWLLTSGAAAQADAVLRSSDPADGASVARAPRQVTLTFTDRPEPRLSTVQVLDAEAGEAVELWALVASGTVTREQLREELHDAEAGHRSTAASAIALAMAELPPEQVRAELAPVWTRLRAGTLALAELPGQRP